MNFECFVGLFGVCLKEVWLIVEWVFVFYVWLFVEVLLVEM